MAGTNAPIMGNDASQDRLSEEAAGLTAAYVPDPLAIAGSIAETLKRHECTGSAIAVTSGTLLLARILLPAGVPITSIAVASGTTALATGTHQWFGLYDKNLNQLAVTSDDTSNAWSASTIKKLPIAATAAGAASVYVTPYSGLYYVGVLVAATTPPSLVGMGFSGTMGSTAPTIVGSSDTGQAAPPAFPHQAAAPSNTGNLFYAYVS